MTGSTVLAAERRGPVVLLTVRRDDGVELEAATTGLDPPRPGDRVQVDVDEAGVVDVRRDGAAVIRRRVVVHGRVQGVWFRESARRLAERRAVTGWVRNRSDGAVEAVLEGTVEDVERLVEFFRTGPSGAMVDRIEVETEPPGGSRRLQSRIAAARPHSP